MSHKTNQIIKKIIHKAGYDIAVHRVASSHKSKKPVAFIHIPKCGGVSIDTALRTQLAQVGERKINRKPLIATSLFNFKGELKTLEDSCNFSEHHNQELQRILTYHLNLNWHYISGHLPVNNKILTHFGQQYDFITVLRDPIDRFISNYIFNKQTNAMAIMPPNKLHNLSTDELIKEAKEILASRRGWQMANTNSLFLTGRYPKDKPDAINMQKEVEKNLTQFKVIGFLDELNKFEEDCFLLTGKKITIAQRNITKKNNSAEQTNIRNTLKEFFNEPSTAEQLNNLCEIETLNYQRAKALYC